jgi:hypothetical protein
MACSALTPSLKQRFRSVPANSIVAISNCSMDDIWQFPNSVLEDLASAQSAAGHPIADDPSLHSAYLPVLPILPHDWPERTISTWESPD